MHPLLYHIVLHELLCVLAGIIDGSIFRPHPPPPESPTTIVISKDFPFLHASERASLCRIAHIGFLYNRICRRLEHLSGHSITLLPPESVMKRPNPSLSTVTQKASTLPTPPSNSPPPQNLESKMRSLYLNNDVGNGTIKAGYYLRSLCATLDNYLEEYRGLIVHAEVKMLSPLDPDTPGRGRIPLSYLIQTFSPVGEGMFSFLLYRRLNYLFFLNHSMSSYSRICLTFWTK
jgi:hypothetical protein